MRDLDRWKDKVELQLDGRQIFFLFFGSAICACLIFVLGVMVGKRVEARALMQAQAPADDPLAALDELGSAEEGLTFHSALSEKREGRKVKAAASLAAVGPEANDPAKVEAQPVPLVVQEEGPKGDKKPAVVLPKDKAKLAAAPLPPAKEGKEGKETKDAKQDPKGKSHFTLQLSAFATKGEASDFMRRLRDAGYKPFITESLIPGKGLMYRVRLGDFVSRDTALSAKGDFERKQKMVAYVAKL